MNKNLNEDILFKKKRMSEDRINESQNERSN